MVAGPAGESGLPAEEAPTTGRATGPWRERQLEAPHQETGPATTRLQMVGKNAMA